jgi:hypothetical protein
MAIQLQLIRDNGGFPETQGACSRVPSIDGQYFTLTASTVTSVTVPILPNVRRLVVYMSFSKAGNVWVQYTSSPTLTLPSGTVTATTAELNPLGGRQDFTFRYSYSNNC